MEPSETAHGYFVGDVINENGLAAECWKSFISHKVASRTSNIMMEPTRHVLGVQHTRGAVIVTDAHVVTEIYKG